MAAACEGTAREVGGHSKLLSSAVDAGTQRCDHAQRRQHGGAAQRQQRHGVGRAKGWKGGAARLEACWRGVMAPPQRLPGRLTSSAGVNL